MSIDDFLGRLSDALSKEFKDSGREICTQDVCAIHYHVAKIRQRFCKHAAVCPPAFPDELIEITEEDDE